jgi:hypothetical protein
MSGCVQTGILTGPNSVDSDLNGSNPYLAWLSEPSHRKNPLALLNHKDHTISLCLIPPVFVSDALDLRSARSKLSACNIDSRSFSRLLAPQSPSFSLPQGPIGMIQRSNQANRIGTN